MQQHRVVRRAAPVDPADLARCLQLSQRSIASTPKHDYMNTVGALLYRSGRFRDAIDKLTRVTEAEKNSAYVSDWLFLAMAHAALGHQKDAERCLDQAGKAFHPYRWVERLESELLQKRRRHLS